MTASIVSRSAFEPGGNNTFDVTLSGTGSNRLIIVIGIATAGGAQTLNSLSVNGVSGTQVASGTPTSEVQYGNISIYVFTDSQHPGAGTFTFTPAWSAAAGSAYLVYELSDAAQADPFITGFTSPNATPNVSTATVTATLSGADGLLGFFIAGLATAGSAAPTTSNASASLANSISSLDGTTVAWLGGYDDAVVSSASEVYSVDVDLNRTAAVSDNIFPIAFAVNPVPPNQPPTADDDTFSIFSNVQNGDEVGTYTATDIDGTVVSYSITGTTLAINNAGVITIADNTGITAGTPITATVTATDDDGATDTAVITVNVTAPKPGIQTVGTIRLGETVPATVDNAVDLSAATTVTATYGGVSVTVSNITANSFDFTAPSAGLQLGVNHDLIVTADGESSIAWSQAFLPPTGYDYVVLTGIDTNSWLNKPQYTGNAGGDANNIGASDQIVYKNTTNEAGTAVTISAVGLPEMPNAVADNVTANQTINWFYLDAQDGYAAGPAAVLTLYSPDQIPQSLVSIDSITENRTSAVVVFSYPGTDATGFEYNIGGNWLAAVSPLTISGLAEQTAYNLQIRPLNNGSAGTATSTTFNTQSAVDTTPNTFSFTAQTGLALNAAVVFGPMTVLGVDAGVDIPVSITNGTYSVSTDNGATYGAETSASTNVRLNYLIRVHHNAAGAYETQKQTTLTVGGVSATASSTTVADPAAGISESSANPLPASIYVRVGTPYSLSQHVNNPDNVALNYALAQGSPALPTGVSLNSSTGEITTTDNNYTPVSGISFEVTVA